MLVPVKKIIADAEKSGYAVGAFNVNNLEAVQAVLRAAEKLKSPVIIQTTEGAIKYAGLKELVAIVKAAAEEMSVPVALHLDHGHDFTLIKKCVQAGYSSVMIDGSALPYKENVALTRKIAKYAHAHRVFVQSELGRLQGLEDWVKTGARDAFLTEPEEARRFVTETGIDALAVAIGNYHGVEKIVEKRPLKLDLKRLEKIDKLVNVPLVLHGASGFPSAQIKRAIKLGIRVINIDSDLRVSFANAERSFLKDHRNEFDPRKILAPATEAMQAMAEGKMRMFGSVGRGRLDVGN
jgi:fructose-bisphosphate aldolase class II